MDFIWTRHLAKLRSKLLGNKRVQKRREPRVGRKLTLEPLEDRTLLSVTTSLNNGVLSISFDAANDQAAVSVVNSNIEISSATLSSGSQSSFVAGTVSGITATGNNAGGQSIAFNNAVNLSGALKTSALAGVTFSSSAAYTAGSASVAAQTIQFNTGAALFTGTGALTLKATNDTSTAAANLTTGANASQASITLNGASLKGGAVNITVTSTSAETFDDTTAAGTNFSGIKATLGDQVLGGKTPITGGVAISTADGEITIGSGSFIAAGTLDLNASASSTAKVTPVSTALAVAYGESDPTAKVVIDTGVIITTTGDFSIDSKADSSLTATAKKGTLNSVSSSGGPVDVTLAVGESTITSTAQIDGGASITVGGKLDVKADMTKDLEVEADAGAYQDGVLGVGVAISQSTSNVTALVGGTVAATGNISIAADSTTTKNTTTAAAQVGQGTVPKTIGTAQNLGSKIKNKVQETQPKPSCKSNATTLPAALSTTVAYGQHTNDATAAIDASAQVTSKQGGVSINSSITDAPLIIAKSKSAASKNSTPLAALSAAVVIGNYTNNSNAYVGQNAVVDANQALTVDSETSIPQNISWLNGIHKPTDLKNYLNSTLGTATGFFASWAQSSSNGQNIGLAGSVNFFTVNDASNAYIDTGAQINQNAQYRSTNQTVTVHAGNDVQTINLSGVFGTKGLGTQSSGAGLGGAYLGVTYNDTVQALIKGGAHVYATALGVTAGETTREISISGSGGKAQTFTLDGTFSQLDVNNTTLAQIDGNAVITTGNGVVPNTNNNILVQASDGGTMIDVSGVVGVSQTAAFGFSVALNNITRDTEALIGDQGTTNNTTNGSVAAGGAVSVLAANTGLIASGSLAAAVTTSPPPSPPPGSPPPPPPPPCIQSTQGTANEPSQQEAGANSDVAGAEGNASSEESAAGSEAGTTGGKANSGSSKSQNGGSFGIGISADVSINTIDDTAAAYIHDANIIQAGSVSLNAGNSSKMYAVAGAVTINAGSKDDTDIGLAGSFSDNNVSDATSAYVQNSSVTTVGAVSLSADNSDYILAIDASGTGSRSDSGVEVAGSVTLNKIQSSTTAYLDGSSIDAPSLSLDATDNSSMLVVAGGIDVNVGGTAGIGLSFSWNQIDNTTTAYATGAAINVSGPINFTATTDDQIQAVAASIAIAPSTDSNLAAGGAVAINSTGNNTSAYLNGGSIVGTNSQPDGALTVSASDNSTIQSIAGDLAATGGNAGIGGSFSWNQIGNKVTAYADNAQLVSAGSVSFAASETGLIETIAAGGDGADDFSLAGAVTLNQINNTISAYLADGANVSSGGNASVMATDSSTIKSLAGAVSGAGNVTFGASFAVNEIGNTIAAYVNNATLTTTGAGSSTDVAASDTGLIATISAGANGAGDFALGGAVSLNQITNTIAAYAANGATVQTNDGNLRFNADDGSTIEALAGTVNGAGDATINASLSLNNVGNTVSAYVSDSTVTILAGGSPAVLTISSDSNDTIETIAAGGTGAGDFSLGGSVSVNFIHSTLSSYVSAATVTDNASDINVSATDSSLIESIAGTITGAGSAAIGASVTVNDIGNTITAYIDQASGVTAGGNVSLSAASNATIKTITGTGSGAGTFTLGGAVSFNDIHNRIQSYVAGGSNVQAADVGLVSGDTSEIESLAVDVSVSGTAAIGAAIAINLIGNTIAAYVEDAKAQSTKKNLGLSALSNATIKSLSAGASGAGTAAITGAVSFNKINNTVEAYASNAAQLTAANTIDMTAQDTSTIQSLSGQVSIGIEAAAIGGAASYNEISNNIYAYAADSSLTSSAGNVVLSSSSAANVQTIAVGGGASGVAGVAGSVAINKVGNDVEAYLDGSTVDAYGSVGVLATGNNSTTIYGGALGIAVGTSPVGLGVGGSAGVNLLNNKTLAYIDNSSQVNSQGNVAVTVPAGTDGSTTQSVSGVAVISQSSENISELMATASVTLEVGEDDGISLTGSVALTVMVDLIHDDTGAYIDGSSIQSSKAVDVNALSGTNIDTKAGSAAVALSAIALGFGATSDTAMLGNTTKAFIDNSSVVTAASVDVATNSLERVNSITVSGGAALTASLAGNVLVVNVADTNAAYIDDATVTATGVLDVTATDAVYLGVRSDGSPVGILSGSLAIGSALGLGGAVEVSSITNSTLAYVTNATTDAGGTTDIAANSTEDVVPYAVSGTLAGSFSAGGAVTINTISVTTQAYASQTSPGLTHINQNPAYSSTGQGLQIEATDNPSISSTEGNVSAGILVGAGAVIDVQRVNNTVTAYIGSGITASAGGNIQVNAVSSKNFSSTVVAGSGGAFGLAGAVSLINVGSDIGNDGSTASGAIGSTANGQISGSAVGGSLGTSTLAQSSTSQVDAARQQNSVSSVFDPNAAIAQATTATLGNNAVITAGGNIQVSAQDITTVQVTAGAAALGFLGGGAGVGIVTLGDSTNAVVGQGASLTAGGNISVTTNAYVTNSYVHTYAGAVGLVGLGAAVAELNSTNNASAYVDSDAAIHQTNNVNVTANTSSTIFADAYGATGGVAAVGVVIANASENGSTQAYLGNDVTVGGSPGQSVGNLTIQAESAPTVYAYTSASAGGVASGDGSVATADANPTVNADTGNGDQIQVSGSISLLAQALGHPNSDAEGESFGGISVGISRASSQWNPLVGAVVNSSANDPAHLRAGQNIAIQAYNNYYTNGVLDTFGNSASTANSSVGTLLGGIGSKANTTGNATVVAAVGNNAVVFSGSNVAIDAESANNLSSTANGDAYGIAVGGSVDADASLANQAVAFLSSSVQLTAGNNVSIFSNSNNSMAVNSTGGQGGLLAVGGAESTAELTSNVTESTVGQNSTVDAGGELQVIADNWLNVSSNTNQTASGGFTSNETDSTAKVDSSLTLAAVGTGVTINVNQFVLTAEDLSLSVSGYSNAQAAFAVAGNNTANTNVLSNTEALASIGGSGTQINAASSVNINALVDFAENSSTALTGTTGVTGSLYSTAENNKTTIANVSTDSGSHITTTMLNVTATVPHNDPNGYVQNAQTNAKTVTKTVTEVVGTVCNVVGTVVCAWGAFCNPQEVCHDITQTITEVLDASTNATTPGSQSLSNTINFNSDVTINGGATPTLKVNSSGEVTQLSGLTATDGNKPLSVGSYVTTGQIDVTGVTSPAAGSILLAAPQGSTSGSSQVNFNTQVAALIQNDSANNLVLGNLELFGGANAPSITQSTSHGDNNWTYTLSTNISGSSLTVDNNNTATVGNDIILAGTIINPVGATILHNSGGNIYATSSAAYINTRLIDLKADQGTIGTSSQSIFLQLPVTSTATGTLPTGFQEAVGNMGVYLDVTPITEKSITPLQFLVNNINSAKGVVVLHIENGLQLENTIGARVTLNDGSTVQGILLTDTFNPATAVNAPTGAIDLGFNHDFTNGQIVTYSNGGGTSIGGLRNGGFYHVQNVPGDPTAVVLGDTFDPATMVDNATGTINFGYDHEFVTGDQVVYDNQGGTSIAGLTNGQVYYVRYINPTTIALTQTLADATAQPLNFAAASVTNNSIDFGAADGLTTGEAVTYQANGSPIVGLTDGDIYYVIVVNSTTIQLAATAADAQADNALSLDATGVTSIQGLLPGIIPLNATGVTGTQLLRVNLNPSAATGHQHSLNSGFLYIQNGNTITPVNVADVQSIQEGTVGTLAPADTVVNLENISSTIGNITIVGGSSQLAATNLILNGTISSPTGTTSISTVSGSIQSGNSSHLVQAQSIDLHADSGAIGANGAVIRTDLTSSGGQLNTSALGDIYLTEIAGALRVGTVTSTAGNIVLTTANDGAMGEDLVLGGNSSITAWGGSITLLAGDDITLTLNSVVSADGNVLIQSDYLSADPSSQTNTIAIDGLIYAGYAEIDGGANNDIISLTHTTKGTPTVIKTGGGVNLVSIGSIAPGSGGVLDNVQGPLTVDGNGSDTLLVDDSGSTAPKTGTLTPTTITGLGMGADGITYSGMADLHVYLGSGGSTIPNSPVGNTFYINDIDPFTHTTVDGGTSNNDTVIATFAQDFNGQLNLTSFEHGTVAVAGNFNGTLTDTNPGHLKQVQIGGSLSSTGLLLAGSIDAMTVGQNLAGNVVVSGTLANLAVGADVSGSVTETGTVNQLTVGGSLTLTGTITAVNVTPGLGNINTLTINGGLAGTVTVSGTIGQGQIGGSLTSTGIVTAGNFTDMMVGKDLAGKVLVYGTLTTLQVGGDVSGSVTETGTINLLQIGGSLTPTGIITAVNATPDLGNINTMTVGKDLCGTVLVSGALTTLEVGGDICGSVTESGAINQLTIGGSLTQGATITAVNPTPDLGNINTLTIGQDLAGTVIVSGTIGDLDIINGSMTPTGQITAGNLTTMVIGPNCLSVGQNMAGQIDVSGTLGRLQVAGGTPGSLVAGHVGTVAAYGGYGPVVLQITENGIQRRVEMGTSADPYPQPNPYALATTPTNPNYINLQYFYESGTLADPQLTARVTNSVSTAPDQFDLSLVVYNDTAKFNLARLDAVGVSGIGNVDIEGDLLTSVTKQAANFFTMPPCSNGSSMLDNTPAGVRLSLDHLIGVGVRDFAPNGYIKAASIEGVAFGSYAEENGRIGIGATAQAEDAEDLLATDTAIVPANGTFRVPFADLSTQQVGFFFDSEEHGGRFDNNNIAFTVQGVSTPNATDTGNIITPNNVARGAVTALVTITPTQDCHGHPEDSVVQTIDLRGDGASIQTQQYIAGGITSTGPLGDLILESPQGITNVTAPSIFGNIIAGGPITGTIQTTGLRTDPITGAVSSVAADLGRVYVAFGDQDEMGPDHEGDSIPYLTATVVEAEQGISGRIISRGNLISEIDANGGIQGVIAAQGNLGETVAIPNGQTLRLGGIEDHGRLDGQVVTLGSIFGNIEIDGGLEGRIAAKGGILGDVTINGGIGAQGALVSGGAIGDASAGTALVVNGRLDGIIAAMGMIDFGKPPHQGEIFNDVGANPSSLDAAAIDAIFAEPSFDVSGLDLEGLDTLLINLLALHVGSDGNLAD